MSTLNVKGIVWIIRKSSKFGTIFTHKNVWVGLDFRSDTYHSKSRFPTKNGRVDHFILARELRSQALKDTTIALLEDYANCFVPSWKIEAAIPIRGNVQAQA